MPYQYWFDIVKARNEEEVLATYELKVKSRGTEKLKKYGIPSEFPAIIHHQNRKFSSYYFAGDFADEPEVPGIYQSELLPFWKKYLDRTDSFYWQAYVPMMKQLLASGLMDKTKTEELVENKLVDGITVNSQTNDSYVQVLRNGKWEEFLIKGVNMGIAKPGYFPGEAAITKVEYARWFKAIGAMNANTVRIYTIHPPAFYEAFYEYNQTAKKPLYLLHGAWVNEEKLIHTQNAYSQEVTDDFQKEIRKMIDVIHGNTTIPEEKGHASGTYSYDISPYVLGFIAGIEWDPEAVYNTNLANPDKSTFNGNYFYTQEASPFEAWLAKMMDFTTDYETKTYKWQHSMSFTNWVTTDLLDHPAEPLESEDKVAVNPNHIKKTEGFNGGLFASYHIYPYYPDVLNLDERYVNYKDENGKENNYLGYLNELMQAHEMPVLVAEFGVPSSRGLTHKNVHGMDQGFHSEQEQGKINQTLFQSIVTEGYAGGIVFSWQDEWFKRTWNTMDYDNPDRRPYWTNTQTNEQRFGLLTFDPGGEGKSITIDGQIGDWERINLKPIYKDQTKQALIKNMYIHSDEGYVYMRFDYQKPINWKDMSSYVLIDSIDLQGQYSVPIGNQKLQTTAEVDFVVNLEGETNSRVLVDSYYDPFYYQYGQQLRMIEENPIIKTKNNGLFHPIRLALNKKLDLPEQGIEIPFQAYVTGQLLFGNASPMSKDFNSLTDISISSDKKVLELRIPWQVLNVRDPSQYEIIGDIWSNGLAAEAKTAGLRIAIVGTEQEKVKSTFPEVKDGAIHSEDMFLYKWKEWQYPSYQERLKDSYYYMKDTFEKVNK
jgi:hypothetical protein